MSPSEHQLWRERIARALAELKKDDPFSAERAIAHAAGNARQARREPNDQQQ